MEYVFCDTGKELKETYEFVDKLEAYLNAHVIRLPKELPGYSDELDFDTYTELYGDFCHHHQTDGAQKLKLEPFENHRG